MFEQQFKGAIEAPYRPRRAKVGILDYGFGLNVSDNERIISKSSSSSSSSRSSFECDGNHRQCSTTSSSSSARSSSDNRYGGSHQQHQQRRRRDFNGIEEARGTRKKNNIVAYSAQEQSKALSFAKDVIAGTCGGITVTLLGHPFDTVKVLLQTQSSTNPAYTGAVDAATKVLKSEGIAGLYKGVMSPLAGQMFFRATLFFSYARAKEFVGVSPDDPLSYCKAGALAWLAGSFFESPIDLFKSQAQQQILRAKADPSYKPISMGQSVKDAIKHMGPRGPWYGVSATLARNLPAGSVYFGVFENTKNYFASRSETGKASNAEICFSGGLGGIFYWTFFYPIDVVKSAIMTDKLNPAERKYKGYGDALGAMYKEGGIGRFYRGLFPCLLRASPANAGMLFTVDYIRRIID
jgi:solute carrier family 25 carnitine/acylcarnitine transporter 20/29